MICNNNFRAGFNSLQEKTMKDGCFKNQPQKLFPVFFPKNSTIV